ncbi:MAG: hypothetical protein OEV42_00465 [Deltaproteobacteria bacterium]|nr:hypothetical protein [Deltaproteobacteria bacterium]
MNLELHHFFILVKPEAEVAEKLISIGMCEGTRNKHEGQGTSNRRFNFSNGTLELLWVHDEEEAVNGPGKGMCLAERTKNTSASPFGVIFNRKDNCSQEMPFEGWKYEPVYFQAPWAFHIGANSKSIVEPLCVYMPFIEPGMSKGLDENETFKSITQVKVHTPSEPMSNVLDIVKNAERLTIVNGKEHLIEVTFNENHMGCSQDFRPDLPLVVNW